MAETGPTDLDPQGRRDHSAAVPRPRPLNSLVASANRLTTAKMTGRIGFSKSEAWQDDAWEMFDLVGEERFLATTLAGRLGQARLYVGKIPEDPIDSPEPLDSDEHVAARVFSYFGDGQFARSQMITRLGVNLFVPGDGWLVGIPRHLLPGFEGEPPDDADPMLALDDLEWRTMSVNEVIATQDKRVTLHLGDQPQDQITTSPDNLFLIRVWRPHPRFAWKADSPTKASLPVLRELVGLTMHISAQVDSRLAGAGLLIVPESARTALAIAAGLDPDSEEDPFTEALIEAMITPISDRSAASAVVPLVVTVPDAAVSLFQHIKFSTALDAEARNLRDEAIRRLALGQDAPPELLLGSAGMNHWGAWLVREDVVTTHLEPPLALICDAITTQFLWPVLIEQGMDEDEAREYVVWYDVSHMIQRPNRLADATVLHDKGVVSDDTLREAGGFSDDDAPPRMARSVEIAIGLAQENPALIDNMPEIIAAFEAVLNPTQVAVDVATEDVQAPTEDVTTEEATAEEAPASDNATVEEETGPPPMAASGRPSFTMEQIVDAFESVPHGREFLEGFLAQYDSGNGNGSGEHDSSVVIVAVPEDSDGGVSDIGPTEKHATLVYLGNIGDDGSPDLEASKQELMEVVEAIAAHSVPFTATVDGIEPLGHDEPPAMVWMLDSPFLMTLNEDLRQNETISRLYEDGTFTKYDSYTPHVTIGYGSPEVDTEEAHGHPEGVSDDNLDEARTVREIAFDRLALWWGDERIEFPLGGGSPEKDEDTMTPEMQAAALEGFNGNRAAVEYATRFEQEARTSTDQRPVIGFRGRIRP